MGKQYTREEHIQHIEEAAKCPETFYKKGPIYRVGLTKGPKETKEKYTEVVAEWLLKDGRHETLLSDIPKITRQKEYNRHTHTGLINGKQPIVNEPVEREEEHLAVSYGGKSFACIGKIIDYQTPLKDKQPDGAGKFDLLGWNESENTLYLLELKAPKSGETILRAVLEIYTYSKIVDREKLLSDFGLPADAKIIPAIMIWKNKGSEESKQYGYLKKLGDNQKKLFEELRVATFLLSENLETPTVERHDDNFKY